MKVVINTCYGGFSLSPLAIQRLAELNGRACYFFEHDYKTKSYQALDIKQATKTLLTFAFDVPEVPPNADHAFWEAHALKDPERHDPRLVQVVEELGEKANGSCAKLSIVNVPDDVAYYIEEYDGNEHVAETHRTWR